MTIHSVQMIGSAVEKKSLVGIHIVRAQTEWLFNRIPDDIP